MKKLALIIALSVSSLTANAAIPTGSTTTPPELVLMSVILFQTFGQAINTSNEWSAANPDKVALQQKIATYNCGGGYNTEMDAYNASLSANCKKVGPALKF